MTRFHADEGKYNLSVQNHVSATRRDPEGGQRVLARGSVHGTTIKPGIRWTPFCAEVFHEFGANGIELEDITCAPDGQLDFINELPACTRLEIQSGKGVDLGPLAGSASLEDLVIYPWAKVSEFDLASLPKLRRCQIPVCRQLMSFLACHELVCLHLCGGPFPGVLNLESLPALKEFVCSRMSKLPGVVLNSKTRLRSLELAGLKSFESIEPLAAVVEELLVVCLDKTPRLSLEWLTQARKVECISLRLGKLPSVNFLKGLPRLQVLDLFGSQVMDGDYSIRDGLKNELDHQFYSDK